MTALAEDVDPFVGRSRQIGELTAILSAVRGGRPQIVMIEGPPGIGKTALLNRFLQDQRDALVLRASGEQWEAMVAYGVVDQLFRAVGVSVAALLASRERALPIEEPIDVGARLIELFADLEQDSPLLVVVDDAHWADLDSLRAVLFALRRLMGERVMAIFALRGEEPSRLPDGLRRLATGATGRTLFLKPLVKHEVQGLAKALGFREFSARSAEQLASHTEGNPLYIRALLEEFPADRWRNWEPALAAPRAFASQVQRRLDSCAPTTRQTVEAASTLGATAPLSTVAMLAGVGDPLAAVEEAGVAGLLRLRDEPGIREVMFPHPLVQAAVYEQIGPTRRARLHATAAGLVVDKGSAFRHRVAATTPPDEGLAGELEEFAAREAAAGAWAGAASALVEASQLSSTREDRERRLLMAVDAMAGAGDLVQANAFSRETMSFAPGPLRDAAQAYLAVLSGRAEEAEALLRRGWAQCDPGREPALAAVLAQRWALHGVGRLRGSEIVRWAGRAIGLTGPGEPARVEADAVLGLGLGWSGRIGDGIAAYESVIDRMSTAAEGAPVQRVKMAHSWLLLVADEITGARTRLAETAPTARRLGSMRIALYAYVWLSKADFLLGNWDDAAVHAERAVSLLEETGHEWQRPLARWAAVSVPAARGEWAAAEDHARLAWAHSGDYEMMIAAAGLARAELAAARADHQGVLRALDPLLEITPREGIDEPGFWPWQDMYADALVSAERFDEADAFLAPHEQLAEQRGRRSMMARLARVRGRLDAAHGRVDAAEKTFQRGLDLVGQLPLPFHQAQLELTYGQTLRRVGQRRAAAAQLQAANERFAALGARPYLDRCERELNACGLSPAKRRHYDPSKLTAQELAVARLVAAGMSNRQVAADLFISIKTVQYHLTHIYAKLGIRSRAELAATLRDHPADAAGEPAAR